VTLLAALRLDDRILIASDGATYSDDGILRRTDKLWRLPNNGSVAWGFAGAEPIGALFHDWIMAVAPNTWDELIGPARERLAELNGEASKYAIIARAMDRLRPVSVLMAGYINAVPNVVALDGTGNPSWSVDENPFFGGSAAGTASIAWEAVRRAVGDDRLFTSKEFVHVIETTVEMAPYVGPPVTVLELTPG
jgi:hypothetical protein